MKEPAIIDGNINTAVLIYSLLNVVNNLYVYNLKCCNLVLLCLKMQYCA